MKEKESRQAGELTAKREVRQFLVLCLRARWDEAAAEEVARLIREQQVDWEAACQLAEMENVGPLLYSSLGGKALLPPAVEQAWRVAHFTTAGYNLLLFDELSIVLDRLHSRGIDVIVLKGAALAAPIYRSIAVRPMADLDMLVKREDAPIVLQTLAELGYQQDKPEPHAGDALAYEMEVLLHKPGQVERQLEVHWGLIDSPYYQNRLPLEWFWQTAIGAVLDGRPIRILSGEAQVLYLCAHLLLHHQGQGLLWLNDVAEVLCAYQHALDWHQIITHAQAFEWVLPLQRIVTSVARDWHAPVPPEVLVELNGLQPSAAEERVFNWLTAQARPIAHRFWADVSSMPAWRGRVHYALRNLFPSSAYMQRRYRVRHAILLPFYYVLRWLIALRGVLVFWLTGILRKG